MLTFFLLSCFFISGIYSQDIKSDTLNKSIKQKDPSNRSAKEKLSELDQPEQRTLSNDNSKFPMVSGEVKYTEIVEVDATIKKDHLYLIGKKWIAEAFNSAKEVIEFEDRESGQINGNGKLISYYRVPIYGVQEVFVSFSIGLYFKDGKYKYEIKNIKGKFYISGLDWVYFDVDNSPPKSNKANVIKMKEDINYRIRSLINGLKGFMLSSLANKDDW